MTLTSHGRGRSAVVLASLALTLAACTTTPDEAGSPPAATPTAAPIDATTTPADRPGAAVSIDVAAELGRLEEEYDSVVGLYAVDTGTEEVVAYREDERFGFASTFKALAAGAVLERATPAQLTEVVTYDADDLVEYSPVTEQHVDDGMTLLEIIDAAVQLSDNTAGNLLLEELGGPAGFQDALRSVGDDTTVSARWETELNEVVPGDPRDTSTPEALARDLRAYALGDVLDDDARAILVESLKGCRTGDHTIRAGVPDGWVVGDKTGAGQGMRNDIGIVWPPDDDPIVLAVLTRTVDPAAETDDALLAEATAVAIEALGH